ncbi:MAG: orotidine-5'-phosphate decarboxylase [Alphaproteobacteria bacterium]|nr:orotidine-5'-phosphate decarboxylase [Alphaproteobacteria bacterium]
MSDLARNIFVAVDTPDTDAAKTLVTALSPLGFSFKLGLEFFVSEGPFGIAELRRVAEDETRFFLDLKLHDIPNTVAGAVKSAVHCDVDFLTIHTAGGSAMIRAAVEAANEAADTTGLRCPEILGVTVLTSLDDDDLFATGISGTAEDQVLRLATLAQEAGLKGLVCSPHELERLRTALGTNITLISPGIRPHNSDTSDQKRVMTPKEAFDAGATGIVIGRPITAANDVQAAAEGILKAAA